MKFKMYQSKGFLIYDRDKKILDDNYYPSIGSRSSSRLSSIQDEVYQFGQPAVDAMDEIQKTGKSEVQVKCPLYNSVKKF